MNDEELENRIIEKVQDRIAIFEFERKKNTMKQIKKSLINAVATVVIVGLSVGTVCAGTIAYEKIWKTPIQKTRQEVITERTEVTEKNKERINISKEEAEQIALLKLQELGYIDMQFESVEFKKFIEDTDTVYYKAKTENKEEMGIELLVNATTKKVEIFTDWNLKKASYVADSITKEDAIRLAKESLLKFEVDLNGYEITEAEEYESNFSDNTRKNWNVSFYKAYDGVIDEKDSASVFFFVTNGEVKINDINIIHDNIFEVNDVVLKEKDAIKIAEDKEKEFSSLTVKNVVAELKIENINSRIYELENNIEMYELLETDEILALTRKENQHYETESIRRKVWKVTIEHEQIDNGKRVANSITEYIRKYSNKDYYIDATTGEIVGGNDYIATGKYSKEMLRMSWGEEEYERILKKYSRKVENVYIED